MATTPIYLEAGVEATYPVPEGKVILIMMGIACTPISYCSQVAKFIYW